MNTFVKLSCTSHTLINKDVQEKGEQLEHQYPLRRLEKFLLHRKVDENCLLSETFDEGSESVVKHLFYGSKPLEVVPFST